MKKFLIFLVVVFIIFSISKAQPPDSCLKMIWPNDYHNVYDSIMHTYYYEGSYNPDLLRLILALILQLLGNYLPSDILLFNLIRNIIPSTRFYTQIKLSV